jgi:hypothetical protein
MDTGCGFSGIHIQEDYDIRAGTFLKQQRGEEKNEYLLSTYPGSGNLHICSYVNLHKSLNEVVRNFLILYMRRMRFGNDNYLGKGYSGI